MQQRSPASKSSNIYGSTVKLPLHKFIAALVHNDLRALVISGAPTEIEILLKWRDIKNEYYQHVAGIEGRRIIDLQLELTLLRGRVEVVEGIVNVLALTIDIRNESTVELEKLLNIKTRGSFKFSPEKKLDDLQRCLKRMNGTRLQIQILQAEIDSLFEKTKKLQKAPTDEWFADTLITLQDHAKAPQINDRMMTYDFCERLKRYNNYAKQVNSRINGK